MKNLSLLLIITSTFFVANAQNKNFKTEQFNIKGNCELAKNTIEKVGSQNRISKVSFNPSTQIATISYDDKKTSSNEVLKNIALAGFDNQEYFAPDAAYLKLPKDCQYSRDKMMKENHQNMNHSNHQTMNESQNKSQISIVFDSYFLLKDAFVNSNEFEIKKQATNLSKNISTVEMGKLSNGTHLVWMKVLNDLNLNVNQILKENKIDKQRDAFAKLSEPFYQLAKTNKLGFIIYYQHCPMFNGGSNWLSKEENIKNPFYGSQMLTCGSTNEIIK